MNQHDLLDILASVQALHYPEDKICKDRAGDFIVSFCKYDGHSWPCREYLILQGVEQDESSAPG